MKGRGEAVFGSAPKLSDPLAAQADLSAAISASLWGSRPSTRSDGRLIVRSVCVGEEIRSTAWGRRSAQQDARKACIRVMGRLGGYRARCGVLLPR